MFIYDDDERDDVYPWWSWEWYIYITMTTMIYDHDEDLCACIKVVHFSGCLALICELFKRVNSVLPPVI